jgi:hypothetical protein
MTTNTTTTDGFDYPLDSTEEQPDDPDDPIRAAVETAVQYHDAMDAIKTWGIDAAAELREAGADEAADLVEAVFWRIELGDRQRGRQPRSGN